MRQCFHLLLVDLYLAFTVVRTIHPIVKRVHLPALDKLYERQLHVTLFENKPLTNQSTEREIDAEYLSFILVVLSSGLFIYDLFWIFRTNIMITVVKLFDVSIKLIFPQDLIENELFTINKFAMLGLGMLTTILYRK
ncbi:hypothetical protein I4U23_029258 [Adineta vaga]|nr:hypothetical protein I4U23_029258 [Adineta vaga]